MNRKKINIIIVLIFSFILIFNVININVYRKRYEYSNNRVVANLINNIRIKYPSVTDKEIIDILNDENNDDGFLKSYGIDIYKDNISLNSNDTVKNFYVINIITLVVLLILILIVINLFIAHSNKKIKKLIYYVEEINKKNYKLDLISNAEGDISILQNEIYKTMVMLKESADNSLNDKENIKKNLSDISHQLKTPLTSISIALDNIIDDPEMDTHLRNEFIMDIKRDIININFLVYNILKLSQFDTNTVKLKHEKIDLVSVIKESIKNVSMLADLKSVSIDFECEDSLYIMGDAKWEIEALTNIIKNSIEHSNEFSKVEISINQTDLYTEVSIKDFGAGIEKKDIKKIFERFYKLSDSDNGFGIGLSLAKEIIESDNGRIKVKSEVGVGTEFIIRYIK